MVLDGADGHAGGDAAHQRHAAGPHVGIAGRGRRQLGLPARAALDDVGREARAALLCCFRHGLGQLDDLDRPGTVRQAADESALLQRNDQPMHARLRLQGERFLHLVEGGRHARLLQARIDEDEQLFLFGREHGDPRSLQRRDSCRTVQTRNTLDVPVMFCKMNVRNFWTCLKNRAAGSARGRPARRPARAAA